MRRFKIPNFVGGLQTKTSYLFHRENELSKLVNARVDSALGALTNIDGYTQIGNTIAASAVVGLIDYAKDDGTRKQVCACNGDLYALSGDTWGAQTQTISTGVQSDFTVFNEKLFWVNGEDAPRTWDQSSWLTTASQNSDLFHAPQGDLIESYSGRVYIADKATSRVYQSSNPVEVCGITMGDTNNTTSVKVEDSRFLYASMVVDIYEPGTDTKEADSITISSVNYENDTIVLAAADTLSDGAQIVLDDQTGSRHVLWGAKDDDYIEFDPSDGDTIMAMKQAQGLLHVWKKQSYHQWNGKKRKRVSEEGTVSPKAKAAYSDLSFWFNQQGKWVWPGKRPQLTSKVVDPEIQQISADGLADVAMGLDDSHLLVSVRDLDEIDNAVIDYDINSNTYQTWETPDQFRIFAPYVTGGKKRLMAGTSDGKIMQLGTGTTFNGEPIFSRIETREQWVTVPEDIKTIYQVFVFAKEWTGISMYAIVNGKDKVELGELKGQVTEIRKELRGNYFVFGFTSAGKSFEIDSIILYYKRHRVSI